MEDLYEKEQRKVVKMRGLSKCIQLEGEGKGGKCLGTAYVCCYVIFKEAW